jgi:hypothetical protein
MKATGTKRSWLARVEDETENNGRFFKDSPPRTADPQWYYHAREGVQGPCSSGAEAAQHLRRLVRQNPVRRQEAYKRLGIDAGPR